jgi:hypothetical protein
MADDRRRWKRLRSELPLTLHVLDSAGGGRTAAAFGSYLNPEGIFIRIADPPALGSRVRVTLDAEGTEGVLTAEGDVVDRVVLDDGTDRPPGIGVRLDHIGPAWTKLYHWLVAEL